MSGRGRQATDRLTRALLDMAARGERANCSDPITDDLWLSESDSERAVAVQLCRHCPVETVCRETAELRDERWGVWGGPRLQPATRTTEEGSRIGPMTVRVDPGQAMK